MQANLTRCPECSGQVTITVFIDSCINPYAAHCNDCGKLFKVKLEKIEV